MANRVIRNNKSTRKFTGNAKKGQNRVFKNRPNRGGANRPGPNRLSGGAGVGGKLKVQDARQKILQSKKKTMVDARDVLAKIAQNQDARAKINKMRGGSQVIPTRNGNIKAIGSHILQKTDRNGKISLVTNKNKPSSRPTTGIDLAIKKQLGLVTSPPQRARNNVQRRLAGRRQNNVPNAQVRQAIARDAIREHILGQAQAQAQAQQRIYRKTIANPYVYEQEPVVMHNQYKWRQTPTAASQLIGAMGRRENDYYENVTVNRPIKFARKPQPPPQRMYMDLDAMEVEDDDDVIVVPSRSGIALQGTSRVSNIHSRLDTILPESHGILSSIKTKVVVPAGHRIVVSNLQNTVSQEDIKELFEDIGELLAARLVRAGVAEVIYKNLKDAQKAVDTYHNRQLDGQPMKCLLVNKRPMNNPTSASLVSESIQAVKKQVAQVQMGPSKSSSSLVPDISTIHKVLFQRK